MTGGAEPDAPDRGCDTCRRLILALAERVYLQHELLARSAERAAAPQRVAAGAAEGCTGGRPSGRF